MTQNETSEDSAKEAEKRSSLTLRLGTTLVFVLVFSVGLSGLLTYFNFEKRHKELISSRLLVMLDEVRLGIDQGTGLGLSLNTLAETNTQLSSLRATDPYIKLAAVITTNRQILFSAGHLEGLNQELPAKWFEQASGPHEAMFKETEDYLLVAEPLFNTFDVQIGIVVLAYQREAYLMKNMALLKQQTQESGIWVSISVVFGLAILWLMMHRLRRVIGRMDSALADNLSGSDDKYVVKNQQDALETQFSELHNRMQEARQKGQSG